MSKTILVPLIAAIAVITKNLTGYEIGAEFQNAIVDIVLFGITIAGIIINWRKPKV